MEAALMGGRHVALPTLLWFALATISCAPTTGPTTAAGAAAAAKPAAGAVPSPVANAAASPVDQAAASSATAPAAFDEQAVAAFYRGKTIRLTVGYAPGGSFDLHARVVARHLPRYTPGNPNVVVENRPGAGGFV